VSTNYYAVRNRPTTDDPIHIGKSACGWLFHFQAQNHPYNQPPLVWNTYEQVKDWLKKYTVDSKEYVIIDEYDEIISYDDFIKLIDEIQTDDFNINNPDNFRNCRDVNGYRFDDYEFS
jgi:hypothetical protein